MVTITNSETFINDYKNFDVILFPMSINNSMSKGITYEIGLNFPDVKVSENKTPYGNVKKYGTIHETIVDGVSFCACYIHNGGYHKNGGVFLNYDALRSCLQKVNETYKGKKIGTVVLGENDCDGCGNKDTILKIFSETCNDINVTIYDYEHVDYKLVMFRQIAELHEKLKNREINGEEYIIRRSKIEWKRKYGIFKKMPEGYKYYPESEKKKLKYIGKIIK